MLPTPDCTQVADTLRAGLLPLKRLIPMGVGVRLPDSPMCVIEL